MTYLSDFDIWEVISFFKAIDRFKDVSWRLVFEAGFIHISFKHTQNEFSTQPVFFFFFDFEISECLHFICNITLLFWLEFSWPGELCALAGNVFMKNLMLTWQPGHERPVNRVRSCRSLPGLLSSSIFMTLSTSWSVNNKFNLPDRSFVT